MSNKFQQLFEGWPAFADSTEIAVALNKRRFYRKLSSLQNLIKLGAVLEKEAFLRYSSFSAKIQN